MATTVVATQQTHNIPAKLTYLEWHDHYKTEKPFMVIRYPDDPPEMSGGNVTFKEGNEEVIHDIRGHEEDFTLDGNGFMFTHAPTSLSPSDFQDDQKIKEKYLPECEEYLKRTLDDVDQVIVFHYRVRNSITSDDHQSDTGPARSAHIDLSQQTIYERIRKRFPERADYILRGRVRLINLWRPINGPIRNWPLAVCDGNTLPEKNIVLTERIRTRDQAVARFLVQSPSMKWYYQSGMEDDTLLVLKNFDSKPDVAKYSAHCSFPLPTADATTPPRESIEIRAVVLSFPRDEQSSESSAPKDVKV